MSRRPPSWPCSPGRFLDESALDDALEASFAELIGAIRVVRNLRAVAGLKPSQSVPVRFVTGRGELAAVLTKGTADITALDAGGVGGGDGAGGGRCGSGGQGPGGGER